MQESRLPRGERDPVVGEKRVCAAGLRPGFCENFDIPREIVGQAWKGKYRGQRQKWFALRFTGNEREIDVANPGGTHQPEFAAWRWEPTARRCCGRYSARAWGLRSSAW